MYRKRVTHGLSVQDILSRGIGGYDEGTARQMLTRLVSAANKRVARMEKGGETSPALQQMKATGGKFSSRGKSGEELQKEFARIKSFLETPTSTIREVRAEKRKSTKAQQKPKARQEPQQKPKARQEPQQQKPKTQSVSDILAKKGIPSAKDLRKMTTILISAANKRLKRMGGDAKREKFSIAGKSVEEVKRVFKEVKAFLESPQGSKKAINKMRANVIKRLIDEYGIKISPEQYDTVFRAYEELRKSDKSIIEREMKYTILQNIAVEANAGSNVEDIVARLISRTTEVYEEQERLSHAFDGVSGFFGA